MTRTALLMTDRMLLPLLGMREATPKSMSPLALVHLLLLLLTTIAETNLPRLYLQTAKARTERKITRKIARTGHVVAARSADLRNASS